MAAGAATVQVPTKSAVAEGIAAALGVQRGDTVNSTGLGNVRNVDQTNAANITAGDLPYARISHMVGPATGKVAAGDDARFNTIPTAAPVGSPAPGRAFIWVE